MFAAFDRHDGLSLNWDTLPCYVAAAAVLLLLVVDGGGSINIKVVVLKLLLCL